MIGDVENDWQMIWVEDIRGNVVCQSAIFVVHNARHSVNDPRTKLTPDLGLPDMWAAITAGVWCYWYCTQELHLCVWRSVQTGFIPRGIEEDDSLEFCTSFFFSLIILDPVSFKCLHPFRLMSYYLNIFSCLFLFRCLFCVFLSSVFGVVLE
jgi:hypothetical protein